MVSAAHWHNLEGCPIIVTENVIEYRKAVSEYVTSEDVVLEVGCAEGLTTALISQISKQVCPHADRIKCLQPQERCINQHSASGQ